MQQTDELNQQFASEYLEHLRRRDEMHSKALISFSGIPGSGKTTLALKLAQDLSIQYVQHDKIRAMITADGYDIKGMSMIPISRLIIDRIMAEDANKSVILDASIDRSWHVFFAHTAEQGMKPIIIRLNVPFDEIKRRVTKRNGADSVTMKYIDTYAEQFEACKKVVKANIELAEDYDYAAVLEQVRRLVTS